MSYTERSRSNKGGVTFRWNYTPEEIARRKGMNKEFYKAAGELCIATYAPFVPLDTGNLLAYSQAYSRKNGFTISYQSKYAYAQYTGRGAGIPGIQNAEGWHRHTKGTTSYWDIWAWSTYGNKLENSIKNLRLRMAKNKC